MKYAVVFPGQGSQSINMLSELADAHALVNDTFNEASDVLNYDLLKIIQTNPEDKLNQTEFTQPAMLAAGVAVWRLWQQQNQLPPDVMAGHSLGEYTALVAAGVMAYTDAVKLVAERGRLMQQAVPQGEGAMAVVLGLDDDTVRNVCDQAAGGETVEAVNFNSPGQIVVAGHTQAVNRAIETAKATGAKRAMLLPVSVPSHSSLMTAAAETLYEHIKGIKLSSAEIPVLHNIDAAQHMEPDSISLALKNQLHRPVLWEDTVLKMVSLGVETILEFGPGKVLAGLCKRIDRKLNTIAVDSPAGLEKALIALQDGGT